MEKQVLTIFSSLRSHSSQTLHDTKYMSGLSRFFDLIIETSSDLQILRSSLLT